MVAMSIDRQAAVDRQVVVIFKDNQTKIFIYIKYYVYIYI